MPPESLRCKECQTTYPLDARYVCERCFGPLEVAYASRASADPGRAASAGSRPARTRCGATATSCPCPGAAQGHAARRAGRRCCGPTGSPSASA